jgi:hypothetical protein
VLRQRRNRKRRSASCLDPVTNRERYGQPVGLADGQRIADRQRFTDRDAKAID